jgi:uncharacterized protein
MSLGYLTIELHIPACTSLKEKRSRLKPLLARLHREFNLSAAEIDRQDAWQETVIACALISSDANQTRRALQQVVDWIETNWPDLQIVDDRIELL